MRSKAYGSALAVLASMAFAPTALAQGDNSAAKGAPATPAPVAASVAPASAAAPASPAGPTIAPVAPPPAPPSAPVPVATTASASASMDGATAKPGETDDGPDGDRDDKHEGKHGGGGGRDLVHPTGKRRYIAVSYDPLTIQISRWGGTIEAVVASHHAIVLSPFYARTKTNEDSFQNVFRGVGGEIGYRYYSGREGPRGFFVSPSLLLGSYDAVPARGDTVRFTNVGGALDVGYQATVADRWVVGLGAGLQYTVPSKSFPSQELPASIYTAKGLRPRLLLALGFTF